MAELIDEVLENELEASSLDDLQQESEETEQPEVETAEVQEETKPEDDLPEKYKNKSLKDIVSMHQEAEKLIGRQGGEVGELRKVVDDFIKTQTSKDSQTTETEIEEEDYLDNPKKAIDNAVNKHPAIKEAKDAALNMKRAETLSRINSEFPDVQEIVTAPEFAEWIKSSRVRTELYTRAEVDYDFDAAKELLANWKEKQSISKKVAETSKVDREAQLKAADVGSDGSNQPVSKKKYRRSDIIKLMQTDPDRYEAMSDEIMTAYREGRVT